MKKCKGNPVKSPNIELVHTLFFILFPCQVCLVTVFIRKLLQSQNVKWKDPMVISILCYIFFVSVYFTIGFIMFIKDLSFVNDYNQSLNECRATIGIAWLSSGFAYWSLIEVYLLRLKSVFAGSIYAISSQVYYSFRTLLVTLTIIGNTLLLIYSVSIDCWFKQTLGFYGRSPLLKRYRLDCYISNEKQQWLAEVPVIMAAVTIPVYNLCLLYMFISRLRSLSQGSSSDHFSALMEKTTTLCLFGIISTVVCFSIIISTGLFPVMVIDMFLNEVMLFMMFKFGNPLYHRLFDRVVAWVKSMGPSLPSAGANQMVSMASISMDENQSGP